MKSGKISKRLRQLNDELQALADLRYAITQQRFFKTGPGEYGEGDIFIGIRVPSLRKLASDYTDLSRAQLITLLKSPIHEERLVALLAMTLQFERGEPAERKEVYQLYLDSTKSVNNWDLVDLSAPKIVGEHLLERTRRVLYRLAESKCLWERRIAIVATLRFIQANEFEDTLEVSARLLKDDQDLIHKAVGWMLREVGKRDLAKMEEFLQPHYHVMPRTMLRYAIEKLPERRRKAYLKGKV